MKNNKLLIVILSLLLIILALLVGILINKEMLNSHTTTEITTVSDKPVNLPTNSDVILPPTDDKGWEYIDKIYFVGDSTTYHFHKGGIDKSHIFVPESLTITLNSNINNVIVGDKGLTISQALADVNAEIVIITLGVNGADNFTETKYKTYYKKLIDNIQELSPNTKIILQSVFPVTKNYSDKDNGISNESIDRLNEWAKEISTEEGLRYLDTQSILKDENGAQFEHYNVKDGVHMNADAYNAIIEYIRTHAIE